MYFMCSTQQQVYYTHALEDGKLLQLLPIYQYFFFVKI